MGPELLIPIFAPLAAEIVKSIWKAIVGEPPKWVAPVASIAAGGGFGAWPVMESTVLEGFELGLAGTGLHQLARMAGVTKRKRLERKSDLKVPGLVLLLALGLMTGCTNTKAAMKALTHGAVNGACAAAHGAVDTGFGPADDLEQDVIIIYQKVAGEPQPAQPARR